MVRRVSAAGERGLHLGRGKDLSRGTILLFFAVGGVLLMAHRLLWRVYLPKALANGAIRGRTSVVILWEDGQEGHFSALLTRHGYRIAGIFQMGPSAEDSASAIDEVINCGAARPLTIFSWPRRSGHFYEVLAAGQRPCVCCPFRSP